jgi:hypothetical protein
LLKATERQRKQTGDVISKLHADRRWSAPQSRMFWSLEKVWMKERAGSEKENWTVLLQCSVDWAAGVIASAKIQSFTAAWNSIPIAIPMRYDLNLALVGVTITMPSHSFFVEGQKTNNMLTRILSLKNWIKFIDII